MKFRPCIDIHNGAVKQIVGGSLKDAGNAAVENYISRQDADYYATMYKKDGLTGAAFTASSLYERRVRTRVGHVYGYGAAWKV